MNHRKITRAERNQLAFILKQHHSNNNIKYKWGIMAPQFRFDDCDILFIHLISLGFTPVEARKALFYGEDKKRECVEEEFKALLFYGGFETTDEFIEYYKINILPLIVIGTKEMVEEIND